jgi:hypothetical protein
VGADPSFQVWSAVIALRTAVRVVPGVVGWLVGGAMHYRMSLVVTDGSSEGL